MLASNNIMPLLPHRPSSSMGCKHHIANPAAHRLREITLYPTQGTTNPELQVSVVSSNADYYAVLNQINLTMPGAPALMQGLYLGPILPIAQSSRRRNNDKVDVVRASKQGLGNSQQRSVHMWWRVGISIGLYEVTFVSCIDDSHDTEGSPDVSLPVYLLCTSSGSHAVRTWNLFSPSSAELKLCCLYYWNLMSIQ